MWMGSRGCVRGAVLAFGGVVLSLAAVGSAAGQATGVVTGRVVVEGTGDAIASAVVEVRETGTRVAADQNGRFRLPRLPVGPIRLRVSSVGFEPTDTTVSVRAGGTTALTVGLAVEPIQISGIEVDVLGPDLRRQSEMEQQAVREANPRDTGELLRQVTGVDAGRRGPLGLDPNVQGLMETQVASFVDGERRFPAGPARMDAPLTHVDPLALRRLQVVKGPYALTWGAGSLSAIRADTERLPPERPGSLHGNLTAGYDTNVNGLATSAGLVGESGIVSYWGFGAYRQGEDYEDGDGEIVPGDYESWETRGKLGFELGRRSRLVVGGGYQDQGPIDYPGRVLDAEFFEAWNASAEYALTRGSGTFRSLDLTAYANDVDHQMTNARKPSAAMLGVVIDTETKVTGGRAATLLGLDRWELEVGGDVYSADRTAVRRIRNAQSGMLMLEDLVWPDVRTTAGGIFVRADRAFAGDLDLSATLRLDLMASRADTLSEWFEANVADDDDNSSTDLSGAATLGFQASPNWRLLAGLGSAVRTPDANELFADRFPASKAQFAAEFVGNPALAPERSTQLDLGFESSYSAVTFQGNVFIRNVADYITLELTDFEKKLPISPDDVYRYVNGEAFFWGFEASAGILVARDWSLDLRTDYLWGEDVELDEPAYGVIPWRVAAGVRYEEPGRRFHGAATLTLAAEQDRVATSRGEAPTDGYATVDLRFGWKLTELLMLRFGVQNLLDEFYVNHLSSKNPFTGDQIPEPGRVLYLNFGVSF